MNEQEVFKAAMDKWGADAQTVIMFEEMAELQKELCKHARGTDNRAHIAEEIADVQIMLEQMIILYGCEEAVREYRRSKIERLKIRLGLCWPEKELRMDKLKPCPFCGGEARVNCTWVRCPTCGAYGPAGKNEAEGIRKWNQRIRTEEGAQK